MECERLLDVVPTETAIKGGSLKLTFLRQPRIDWRIYRSSNMHTPTFRTWSAPHVPRLLSKLGSSEMVTTTGGHWRMWCNVLGQCSTRIFVPGTVQSDDDADCPVSGTQHTPLGNPSKTLYLYFYHSHARYSFFLYAHVSSAMVLVALVYWSSHPETHHWARWYPTTWLRVNFSILVVK